MNELRYSGEIGSRPRSRPASLAISRTVSEAITEMLVIEDAMIQLHHLHGSPVAASHLRGQAPKTGNSTPSGVRKSEGRLPVHRLHGAAERIGAVREACLLLAKESRCGRQSAGTPGVCHHPGRASQGWRPASRSPPTDFTGYRKIASTCPISMSTHAELTGRQGWPVKKQLLLFLAPPAPQQQIRKLQVEWGSRFSACQ